MCDNVRRINFIGLTGTMLSDLWPLCEVCNHDVCEGGAFLAIGPVVAESSPPPEDREGTSPSPRPSPPPSPGYWEDRRCSELEKENRQFRFALLKVRAELRQTKVDLLDAEAEVSELFDKYRHWKGEAESKQQVNDAVVGGVLAQLRPDMYAGYKNGKVVYVWERNKAEKEKEIERRGQEIKRRWEEELKTRGIRRKASTNPARLHI